MPNVGEVAQARALLDLPAFGLGLTAVRPVLIQSEIADCPLRSVLAALTETPFMWEHFAQCSLPAGNQSSRAASAPSHCQ